MIVFSIQFVVSGEEYVINESVKVIPTPGHTLSDVTVLVKSIQEEVIAIAGKILFKNNIFSIILNVETLKTCTRLCQKRPRLILVEFIFRGFV